MNNYRTLKLPHLSATGLGILLLWIFLSLSGCTSHHIQPLNTVDNRPLRKDGRLNFIDGDGRVIASISIEIVETPESRRRGLMGRRSMAHSTGMFFIFPRVETQAFWMRNTPLSLDIIFIGGDSRVMNIASRTQPMSDTSYRSRGPVKFVLEVNAGFAENHGIEEGTRVEWQRM